MQDKFKSLPQLLKYFEKEETCIAYLELQRWGGNIVCPHCGHNKVYHTARGYKCAEKTCRKKFSVTSGTILESTKIKLQTWFAAFYLVTSHKKGISSHQLARDLNITQKSAWFVLHRIREMLKDRNPDMLTGTVEADETFVGGKGKNKHAKQRKELYKGQRGYSVNHQPVFGVVQRGGKVILHHVSEANRATLTPILFKHVSQSATVVTDGFGAYRELNKYFNQHVAIEHIKGEYERDGFHTNMIENVWSIFKRGIIGIYHGVSPKHLNRYCGEFAYRYNTRKDNSFDRFTLALAKTKETRITYKQLIGK